VGIRGACAKSDIDFKTQSRLPGLVGINVIRRCNKTACRFIIAAAVRAALAIRAGEIESGDSMVAAVHLNVVPPFSHSSFRLFNNLNIFMVVLPSCLSPRATGVQP
jgi:hypothetical protein